MKAVYGGKTESAVKDVKIPETNGYSKTVEIGVDRYTGCLTSIKADGKEVLKRGMSWNILRYTDNERTLVPVWNDQYHLSDCKPEIYSFEEADGNYKLSGCLAANCMTPAVEFSVEYKVFANELAVDLEYEIADYIEKLPRFGFELGIAKEYSAFSFIGFGKTESYIDKNVACDYGYHESTAEENYDNKYIRPQESGSHYKTVFLSVENLFSLTAEKDFSFSLNPYTTKQLLETQHNFELHKNEFLTLCLDLGMRGVGSHSCGPELSSEFEISKKGKNSFKFKF